MVGLAMYECAHQVIAPIMCVSYTIFSSLGNRERHNPLRENRSTLRACMIVGLPRKVAVEVPPGWNLPF
jgi:hypothetical protein